MQIAQTNIQLYNQLRERGMELDDLALVNRAYELLISLYPAYFQADGKPFVAHGVGVASILAALDQPAEVIAAGLLHNVYGNADFGDARGGGRSRYRRGLVRRAVGERVEEMLARFQQLRVTPSSVEKLRRALPEMDDTDRALLLVDLADHLEKYTDLGVLYFGENDWIVDGSVGIADHLIEIAHELGHAALAAELAHAYAEAAAQEPVPPELRPSDGRRYLKLVMPRSCRPRRRPIQRMRSAAVGRLRA